MIGDRDKGEMYGEDRRGIIKVEFWMAVLAWNSGGPGFGGNVKAV